MESSSHSFTFLKLSVNWRQRDPLALNVIVAKSR